MQRNDPYCRGHRHPKLSRPISRGQVRQELADLYHQAGFEGPVDLEWHRPLGRTHDRNWRRYAQVAPLGSDSHFQLAPQVTRLPARNRHALLAHEVGHVLDPRGSEDEADEAAMQALGIRIGYDHRWPGKGLQVARNPRRKVGTTRSSRHVHDAVDTVGGWRPACRKADVRAVLRLEPSLDGSDTTCPRCLKARVARNPGARRRSPDARRRSLERHQRDLSDVAGLAQVLSERLRSGRIARDHLELLVRMGGPDAAVVSESFGIPLVTEARSGWERYRKDDQEAFYSSTDPSTMLMALFNRGLSPDPRFFERVITRTAAMQWLTWWLAEYGKARIRPDLLGSWRWEEFRANMNRHASVVLAPEIPEVVEWRRIQSGRRSPGPGWASKFRTPAREDLRLRASALSESVQLFLYVALDGDPRNHEDVDVPESLIAGCWDDLLDDYDQGCVEEVAGGDQIQWHSWLPEPGETMVHGTDGGDRWILRGYIPHELLYRDFMRDLVPALEAWLRGDL